MTLEYVARRLSSCTCPQASASTTKRQKRRKCLCNRSSFWGQMVVNAKEIVPIDKGDVSFKRSVRIAMDDCSRSGSALELVKHVGT